MHLELKLDERDLRNGIAAKLHDYWRSLPFPKTIERVTDMPQIELRIGDVVLPVRLTYFPVGELRNNQPVPWGKPMFPDEAPGVSYRLTLEGVLEEHVPTTSDSGSAAPPAGERPQ